MINVQHSIVSEEQFPYQTLPGQELEAYASIRYSTLSIDRAGFSSLLADFFGKTMKRHQPFFAHRKDTSFLEILSAIDQEYALPQGN